MLSDSEDGSSLPVSPDTWDTVLTDPPWNDRSFAAAGVATAGGLISWLANLTSPAVVQMGGSFLSGFLIGWAFRKFLKMAALIAGILFVSLAAMKTLGWINLDWTSLYGPITQGFRWLHGEAEGLKNLLTGYMPSAGAGGAGAWCGFRRKSRR